VGIADIAVCSSSGSCWRIRRSRSRSSGGRLEAQLVEQVLARAPERLERVRLPACAVEREHQLPVPALSDRRRRDECVELADHLGGAAERELRLDALLLGLEPQLFETCDLGAVDSVRFELLEEAREAEPARAAARAADAAPLRARRPAVGA
jgi:hypothetical protein